MIDHLSHLKFPCLGRPSIRGPMVEVRNGVARWPNTKEPLGNHAVMDMLAGLPNYVGNITTTDPYAALAVDEAVIMLNEEQGFPEIMFWVWDLYTNDIRIPFSERLEMLTQWIKGGPTFIYAVEHRQITTARGVTEYEQWCERTGHNGATFINMDQVRGSQV